ncbi:MAG TPA: carbohydrate porin [Stellaceae bacterium]|nr:carbohydrate porin [Stellaceae bacterium]
MRSLTALALALLLGIIDGANADDTLSGDWGGLRTELAKAGFELGIVYIGETFADLAGGIHRGTVYEGRLAMALDVDLKKLAGWQGGTFHASMYQIHGHGPSANLVGNFFDVSSIEALPSTRLFTLWLQQNLFDDRLSIRLGQLAMDDEFLISTAAANLVNADFGDPAINYENMTAGGPIYPVADPGLRVQVKPRGDLALLAAVFGANPGGGNCAMGVQLCDPSGTTFSFSGGTLWAGELQYSINQGNGAGGLPGTYRIGSWRETGGFADQHFGLDASGAEVSLASPNVASKLFHGGDYALYGVLDQMLWRRKGTQDQGLSGFLRLGGAPADRNLVSFYADGGLSWKGFPGRPDDIAILGLAYAAISPAASGLDRDGAALAPGHPIRDAETVVELSWLAQVRPWLVVQPDLQYIVHPGGNVPNPNRPPTAIPDALIVGLRTTITF